MLPASTIHSSTRVFGPGFRAPDEKFGMLIPVMGNPGPCPACETSDLERRGGKDFCPSCYYIQPCCDGGFCE